MKRLSIFAGAVVILIAALFSACSESDKVISDNDGITPKIVSVYPADGAVDIPVETNFVIVFSEPMDRASVEDHFGPYYMSGGMMGGSMMQNHYDGEFHWNADHDTLHYQPHNFMMGGSLNYIEFHEGMHDHDGNPLHDLDGNLISESHYCSFNTK